MSKQRLIDKDVLEEAVQGAINIMESNGISMIAASVPLAIIKGAPTIDAIPVEWIEDRLAKMLKGKECGFVECATIQALLVSWENHKIHLQAMLEREAR